MPPEPRPALAPAAELVDRWLATGPSRLRSTGEPRPVQVFLAVIGVGPFKASAVARVWADGDSGPAGTCRRCSTCKARENVCLILTSGVLTRDQAIHVGIRRDAATLTR